MVMSSIECITSPSRIVTPETFTDEELMRLDGKTALITGSTSGIGLGIARSLARRGANIVLNGFGDVEGSIEQIAALGVKVGYHGADMSKKDDIAQLIDYVQSEFGGTDILVNNAGIQHVARIKDFPDDEWDRVIAINMSAAFHTTKLALPGMIEKDWGRIINIASAHGLVASAGKAAYVTAKHGVVGLTKTTALDEDVVRTGVTVNAICPGWVLTPLVQKQIDDLAERQGISLDQARQDLLGEKQPSLQFVTTEQLGGLAVFLCSSSGDNMRGSIISMDGGWTAQ